MHFQNEVTEDADTNVKKYYFFTPPVCTEC